MTTLHMFELHFNPVPVGFDVLCVGASNRVDEMEGVVDGAVGSNWRELYYLAVRSPLVGVNDRTRSHVGLDDGEQCCSIPRLHQLHVA